MLYGSLMDYQIFYCTIVYGPFSLVTVDWEIFNNNNILLTLATRARKLATQSFITTIKYNY